MATAILVPCGVRLRSDFNTVAPVRYKTSDGWIGDTAHQREVSDHNPDETGSVPIHDADRVNEVHAVDVDVDLNESDLTMEKVVQFLLGRCRSGAENRLRYIIYNRRIWEASNGWKQRAYTGPSPHTEHAHFSFSYDTAREAATASWHLEDIPVALTPEDKKWLAAEIDKATKAALAAAPAKVWAHRGTRVGSTDTVSMEAVQVYSDAKLNALIADAGLPAI
jgi:hypothetical protein